MIDFPGERLDELDIYAVGEVDMKGVAMLTVYCWSVCSINNDNVDNLFVKEHQFVCSSVCSIPFFILFLISQPA